MSSPPLPSDVETLLGDILCTVFKCRFLFFSVEKIFKQISHFGLNVGTVGDVDAVADVGVIADVGALSDVGAFGVFGLGVVLSFEFGESDCNGKEENIVVCNDLGL